MKTHQSFFILFLSLLLNACSEPAETNQSEKTSQEPLAKQWQLSGLKTPESVIYDSNNDVLYVSNVNGSPIEKDNNGFISKVSLSGELLELKWLEGLDAPKGLAIHNGKLYVSDIDALVEIDIASAAITNRYVAEGAKFLNDVTVTSNGEVFVSDMLTNTIHNLKDGEFSIWLNDDNLQSPNGVHAEANRLVVGAWGVMTDGFATEVPGHMKSISYDSKEITSFDVADPIGNLDGIESNGEFYLVTDWIAGKLFRINKKGEATLLLELEQGMADHEWLADKNLILLPMMKNDTLLAYSLN